MSKFNELYGYLSDRQTPHLFVIAEVLYGLKEAMDKQNEHLASISASLEKLAGQSQTAANDETANA
ncbi:hypothetical protein COW36_01810 [bacterium (Candidatus Blackallbacteria) CG17_big_fil_post_rev_8_21_14_2_50_48_46]|uniref:Uncharacterized protein n=1 Tax=bacterium (Candidatus Blackallbacteria) CG17_big_fil_post_rev_8_21_14_2_50_48_46 TaxID=2014261 RepID=A0A2M7GAI7_9BACT|nr:MAG: hypothetical protein COW64_26200 [bacterium (Candidatus Blackallbacteria) CG18_big_fil_WC_8_21_14_2_50_49_26]PIW19172.1 MAG: hypothetical protein COW36_01810 [bacterium (Candidatus Blackallbacteria) CG17_big_fil_post_rev_8_21_14_2_50_48_46]PIW45478.1 MAG: hypothetical protein COW20_20330 [bacterium (Candidatus Blackallbacteria) CG13_big_fil_rev_8_21_14_2_50_49_14]